MPNLMLLYMLIFAIISGFPVHISQLSVLLTFSRLILLFYVIEFHILCCKSVTITILNFSNILQHPLWYVSIKLSTSSSYFPGNIFIQSISFYNLYIYNVYNNIRYYELLRNYECALTVSGRKLHLTSSLLNC